MEAHPDPNRLDAVGKVGRRERPLGVDCGRDRGRRGGEHDEERVTLGADLGPAVGGPRGAQEVAMHGEHVAIAFGPELLDEPGRAFDVGEQEGQGAARQGLAGGLAHRLAVT